MTGGSDFDLVVRSRAAVLPEGTRPAAVAVRAGRIAAVAGRDADLPAAAEVDLGAEALLPGLVDTHVHVNEPGRTGWEGFATATLAAAAGGVTTVVDMPLNSIPPTVTADALAAKRAAARGRCHVDVGFWGGAVPGNEADLPALHEAGVFGVKCFLVDSGVAEFPPLDPAGLRAALRRLAGFGGLLLVHAEDPGEVRPCAGPSYAEFLASRPPVAERRAIEQVVAAARATGGRTHIVHLAAAETLALVAGARAAGIAVTAETCPHYLALSAADVPPGATEFKCCPPIRDAANRAALWRGLAGGVIDIVVSDHSPCPPELKLPDGPGRPGDFAAAWGGIASVQLGLPVTWTAARTYGHDLADVVRWMAQRPAELAGIPGKGRLAVGYDADMVAFAPDEAFRVDPGRLLQRHPLTPYAGRTLTGVVRRTWLRGVPVDPAGTPRGRLLRRPA